MTEIYKISIHLSLHKLNSANNFGLNLLYSPQFYILLQKKKIPFFGGGQGRFSCFSLPLHIYNWTSFCWSRFLNKVIPNPSASKTKVLFLLPFYIISKYYIALFQSNYHNAYYNDVIMFTYPSIQLYSETVSNTDCIFFIFIVPVTQSNWHLIHLQMRT